MHTCMFARVQQHLGNSPVISLFFLFQNATLFPSLGRQCVLFDPAGSWPRDQFQSKRGAGPLYSTHEAHESLKTDVLGLQNWRLQDVSESRRRRTFEKARGEGGYARSSRTGGKCTGDSERKMRGGTINCTTMGPGLPVSAHQKINDHISARLHCLHLTLCHSCSPRPGLQDKTTRRIQVNEFIPIFRMGKVKNGWGNIFFESKIDN